MAYSDRIQDVLVVEQAPRRTPTTRYADHHHDSAALRSHRETGRPASPVQASGRPRASYTPGREIA